MKFYAKSYELKLNELLLSFYFLFYSEGWIWKSFDQYEFLIARKGMTVRHA